MPGASVQFSFFLCSIFVGVPMSSHENSKAYSYVLINTLFDKLLESIFTKGILIFVYVCFPHQPPHKDDGRPRQPPRPHRMSLKQTVAQTLG